MGEADKEARGRKGDHEVKVTETRAWDLPFLGGKNEGVLSGGRASSGPMQKSVFKRLKKRKGNSLERKEEKFPPHGEKKKGG